MREKEVDSVTKNRFWRIALPVAVVLWTGFIWYQSLLSAADSSAESGRVVRWLMGLIGWENYPDWIPYAVRKAAHLTEFALLGGLWCGTSRTYDRRRLWLWGMATGAVDECLQFLAPGRAPMVTDVLLDTVGYLCGVGLVWFIAHLWSEKQK